MKKFTLFLGFLCFTFMASAQMPEAISIEPADATAFDELTLTLDVTKSCPDGALLDVEKVMIHSGVTIGDTAMWQLVVPFDGTGADGQMPKLWPVIDTMPPAVTIFPPDATAWDTVTLMFDAKISCPVGALMEADSVMIHSGVTIDGSAWQNVVDFDAMGANGQQPKLTHVGNHVWSITYVPADFYDIADGSAVTAINCVFNNGTWDAEGKDFDADSSCVDFKIPLMNTGVTKWQITYNPATYYGIAEGTEVTAINCVFNNGTWDAEGKDFDEDDNCVDFYVPFQQTNIPTTPVSSFEIYPNPVENTLYVENMNEATQIEVYNLTGSLLMVVDVNNADKAVINTSDLNSGVYFISVKSTEGIRTSRFVKQ